MLRRMAVILAAVCGAASLTVGLLTTSGPRTGGQALANPVLGAPATVDLGVQENGSVAEARFALTNAGGGVLSLSAFRTDCACNALELEEGGRFVPLDRLSLAGGQSASVRLRKTVRGAAGQPMDSVVRFQTTDPDRPEAAVAIVVARVLAGVTASPPNWVIGSVNQGSVSRREFDLFDSADPPRAVERVESSDPNRVRVEFLPADPAAPPQAGRLPTGRLVVTIDTTRPGPVDGSIRLHVRGGKATPDAIGVTGRVVAPVECSPAALSLPRRASSGTVYAANCLVRATAARRLELRPTEVPEGVRVEVSPAPAGGGPIRMVQVSIDPQAPPGRRTVRLACETDGWAGSVEVAVDVVALPEAP